MHVKAGTGPHDTIKDVSNRASAATVHGRWEDAVDVGRTRELKDGEGDIWSCGDRASRAAVVPAFE